MTVWKCSITWPWPASVSGRYEDALALEVADDRV